MPHSSQTYDPGGRPAGGRLGRLGVRRNQLTGALALVIGGLVMMTLGPGRGLLVLGLTWVLVRFLASHRDDGGRRQQVRSMVEYAAVAALVVAVLTAMPAPDPPKAKAPPRRPAATERAQVDPWGMWRTRWDKFVDRVSTKAPVIQFGTDAKEGHR
jgi:hypothetical protein